MSRPKKTVIIFLASIFVYLSIFTWNLRTGVLDSFSSHVGLDFSAYVIQPGLWVKDHVVGFWEGYIYLVNLKQQNDELLTESAQLQQQNMQLREQAAHAKRVDQMLEFVPPKLWKATGARVIAHRMGPAGVLETLTVDKGGLQDVLPDMPVLSLSGVVGRVLETGAVASTILLVTDPNSRLAVLGAKNRSPGMLSGQGYGHPLKLRFVNLNAQIDTGEELLTSGLSGIFPKGLPVARVTKVQRSDISLFLTVEAEPLIDVGALEELFLLRSIASDAESRDSQAAEADGAALQ